jgi:hypothetical protein
MSKELGRLDGRVLGVWVSSYLWLSMLGVVHLVVKDRVA